MVRKVPSPEEIQAAKDILGLSYATFAAEVGVDKSTVFRWTKGTMVPSGLALKVLQPLLDQAKAKRRLARPNSKARKQRKG